jgi:hypothetical protein
MFGMYVEKDKRSIAFEEDWSLLSTNNSRSNECKVHILFKSFKSRAKPNELPGIATTSEWSCYRKKKCNLMELLQR